MTVLYIREQGAVVRRDGEQVKVTQRMGTEPRLQVLQALPIRELEQVVLYGNVQLTTQVIALLLAHEVDVVFLSLYGKFRGRLLKTDSRFARLRHAQLQLAGNDQQALAVARNLVRAKVANQRNLLQSLAPQTTAANAPLVAQAIAQVEAMRQACSRATTADTLRGFEGRAGASYFGALKALLDPTWGFQGRAFHPSPDPFNALLSFGYALLRKDVTATLQLIGLDPYLGCFHVLEYDRPSLALDLMEEFRPVVVDQALLALVLTKKLKPSAFVQTGQPEQPVTLESDQLPVVIRAYEERINSYVLHRPSATQRRLRDCLILQARIFERVVLGERAEYEGLVVDRVRE